MEHGPLTANDAQVENFEGPSDHNRVNYVAFFVGSDIEV